MRDFNAWLEANQFRQVSKFCFVDTSGVIPETKELEAILTFNLEFDPIATLHFLSRHRKWWRRRVEFAQELKEYWMAESPTFSRAVMQI